MHEVLPARQVLWRRHIEPIADCESMWSITGINLARIVRSTVARELWKQMKLLTGIKFPNLHPVSRMTVIQTTRSVCDTAFYLWQRKHPVKQIVTARGDANLKPNAMQMRHSAHLIVVEQMPVLSETTQEDSLGWNLNGMYSLRLKLWSFWVLVPRV